MNRKVALGFAALTIGLIHNAWKLHKTDALLVQTMEHMTEFVNNMYQIEVDRTFEGIIENLED